MREAEREHVRQKAVSVNKVVYLVCNKQTI